MITSQPTKKDKSAGKKPSTSKKGQNGNRNRPQDHSHKKKKKESPQFTPLNISYERLLPLIRDLPNFKWPAPIQTDPAQRNKSLRCDYHKDHGHEIVRCRSLKFLVEKLIKAGHLWRHLEEVGQEVELGQFARRIVANSQSDDSVRAQTSHKLYTGRPDS